MRQRQYILANQYDCMGNLCGFDLSNRFPDGPHWMVRNIYEPANRQWYDTVTGKSGNIVDAADGEGVIFIQAS